MKTNVKSVVLWSIGCVLLLVPSLHAGWILEGVPICVAPYIQRYPVIASDGAGGAIIAWSDSRTMDFNIYAQRINAHGDTLWPANGVALCDTADVKSQPQIISDGAGGAFITWQDRRTFLVRDWDIYAQRIDANGTVLWASNGLAICDTLDKQEHPQIVSDGSGGAVIVWDDLRSGESDIYAQRVDANGDALWSANGVAISRAASYQNAPQIIPDGAGGAIIAWEDTRDFNRDVYAQRVDANGDTLWQADGIPICTAEENQWQCRMTSDGAGGAIITWYDQRDLVHSYIYAQRVDANGDTLWPADGITVCTVADYQYDPRITSDGDGGAIIAWEQDLSGNQDIHAQRIDGSGNALWTANGVAVCTDPDHQANIRIISDGSGGAILAWEDERNGIFPDVYAQRLDASGNALWTANGVAVCTATNQQWHLDILSDGSGGAIFTWDDARSGDFDIYASLADANGQIVPTLLQKYSANIHDGAIVVRWTISNHVDSKQFTVSRKDVTSMQSWSIMPVEIEGQDGSYSFTDATCLPGSSYRYRVDVMEEDGQRVLFETDPMSVPEMSLVLYQNYPNPFSPSTTVRYYLPEESKVTLSVYDLSGELISRLISGETKPRGFHTMEWDGKDEDGRRVASGVYFYRLTAGSFTEAKRMILLR